MASNVSDDGQTNTSVLSTARSNPTVPTNLQGASDYSVIGNTDALTTEFEPADYAGIDQTRLLGHHIPHLTTGKRYGPIWQYRYDIEHSKTGKGRDNINGWESKLTPCQDSQQTYIDGRSDRNDGRK